MGEGEGEGEEEGEREGDSSFGACGSGGLVRVL